MKKLTDNQIEDIPWERLPKKTREFSSFITLVIDETIERRLSYYVAEKGLTELTLKVSPILGAYLTKGIFNSILGRWKKKYKCKIELVEGTDFTVLQNEFYNEKGEKLD